MYNIINVNIINLGIANSTSNASINQSNIAPEVLDLSVPKNNSNIDEHILPIVESNVNSLTQSADGSVIIPANGLSHMEIDGPTSQIAMNAMSDTTTFDVYNSRLIIVAPTSKDIQKIKLPHKNVSVGRPKGSSTNTVIGTKRKKAIGKLKVNF